MENSKASFIIRKKYRKQIELLDNEKAWMLFKAIMKMQDWEVLENADPVISMLLSVMEEERKTDDEKYKEVCEKNRENIKKRRANKKVNEGIQNDTTVYDRIPTDTKNTDNDNDIWYIKKEITKEKKINRFEEFWNAYPLKKWKKKAEERYNTALKNWVSEDLLITKAKEYAEECRIKNTELKYIKRPEGWINGWRYEDTYITAKPKQVKSEDKPYDFTQKPTLIRPKLPWITNLKKES